MIFRDIETVRLFLKSISADDREFILAMFSNDEVNRFLFDAEPISDLFGADELIDFYVQKEPRDHHRWVLVGKEYGVKLGTCGFHCWDKEANRCDIGYDLHPEFWGKGYMAEAIPAIIRFARNEMGVTEINACIYIENERSIRLAEKCGFIFRGEMKDEVFRGKKYPHRIYTFLEGTGEMAARRVL